MITPSGELRLFRPPFQYLVDDFLGFFHIALVQRNFFREMLSLQAIVEFSHFISNMSSKELKSSWELQLIAAFSAYPCFRKTSQIFINPWAIFIGKLHRV